MITTRTIRVALAALALGLVATAAATAAGGGRGHNVLYQFRGHLQSASASAVSLTVEGGNRPALKAMLGATVSQTFAAAGTTEFLHWAKGTPTVVGAGDLARGDWVVVNVRAPRGATLAQLEATPAAIVSDRGTAPDGPGLALYLFRGTFVSAGSSSLTVTVHGGNRRALRLLLGRAADETFAYGPETIFLRWTGKVPTVISPSQLAAGDRVAVRIRAKVGTSLGALESTPARHVGAHEPANAQLNG